MKKITKLKEIKHQNKLLLFSISQKHNYNSCNQNELTYIYIIINFFAFLNEKNYNDNLYYFPWN